MAIWIIGAIVLAVVGGLWAFGYRARKAGEAAMSAKVAQETADTLRRQDKAAAEAPKTKDELIDRLRRGGF
jgi:hypothetical protein